MWQVDGTSATVIHLIDIYSRPAPHLTVNSLKLGMMCLLFSTLCCRGGYPIDSLTEFSTFAITEC